MKRLFVLLLGVVLVSSAAAEEDSISIAAVGDVMLGSTWPEPLLPPEDGVHLLKDAKAALAGADLAFGNLEGPLLDEGEPVPCRADEARCFRFRVPIRYVERLRDAGFDLMSLGNNHAFDFGPTGLESSQSALDGMGIAHSGPAGAVARRDAGGRRVVMAAFAPYVGLHDLNDVPSAVKIVEKLAAENDIVIVSFHGGAEGARYSRVPRGVQRQYGQDLGDARAFSHAVVDAGADLVLGHGPHVLRGMEVYKDRLIAYSLGNFATYGRFNLRGALGRTLILKVRLGRDGEFLDGKILPMKQTGLGGPSPDPKGAAIAAVRKLSKKDFGERGVRVLKDGTVLKPE